MAQLIEVKVPDIGDFSDIPVIELNVKVGDTIAVDDSICTLESDKATMDVPSSVAGVVKEILVGIGSKVSEGTVLVKVEGGSAASAAPTPQAAAPTPAAAPATAPVATPAAPAAAASAGGIVEVKVPDIGDFDAVPVIELNVKVGDTIAVDDSICTLESDKATMDVPSSAAGVVKEVLVKVGDKVGEGALLIKVETAASAAAPAAQAAPAAVTTPVAAAAPTQATATPAAASNNPGAVLPAGGKAHASPSVRAYARELGADLGKVAASGPKGRITKDDVTRYVKGIVAGAVAAPGAASGGVTGGGTLDLLPWPKVDFAKFGPVEAKPLSRIKKISGANLARNWVMIPHVTQFDEADITDLEAFRVQMNKENEKSGAVGNAAKLTMLAFLIKACVAGLKKYPEFNASLDGDNLVLKQYFHIGFAADTPNGLVVPVIRDCDKKGLLQIAQEMGDLAKKARDGKLGPADMTGGCFSISSLGGIGGTAFTPIINAPEVAILGVSKTQTKPVWDGKQFVPKQMLPLSLSYDHRVIDGAAAARFTAYLGQVMADFRRIFL